MTNDAGMLIARAHPSDAEAMRKLLDALPPAVAAWARKVPEGSNTMRHDADCNRGFWMALDGGVLIVATFVSVTADQAQRIWKGIHALTVPITTQGLADIYTRITGRDVETVGPRH
jgi:hypothetical protein